MVTTADALIVGAGIVCASTALELSRCGLNVLAVGKAGGAGMGSTRASSAVIRFNYSTWEGVGWITTLSALVWPSSSRTPTTAPRRYWR